MCAKYVSQRLLQSERLSGRKPAKKENARSSASRGGHGGGEAAAEQPAAIEPILDREHKAAREKAEGRNLIEVARRRNEVEEKLNEFAADLERREQETHREIELCRELANKLRAMPVEVTRENVSEVRRLVRQADLELLKRERDQTEAEPRARDHAAATLPSLTFMQLTRLGLGMTWPLLLGILIAALFVGGCLLAVFRV